MNRPSQLTRRLVVTALFSHVRHVVLMGSEKQMVGTDTCGIVATVKHMHTVRNIAMREHPRDTVSCLNFAVISTATVAEDVSASSPFPASVRLVDSSPEPILKRNSRQLGSAWSILTGRLGRVVRSSLRYADASQRTVTTHAALDLPRHRHEIGVARFACPGDGSLLGHGNLKFLCRAGGVQTAARRPHASNFTIPKPKTGGGALCL